MNLERLFKEQEALLNIKSKILSTEKLSDTDITGLFRLKEFLKEKEKVYSATAEEEAKINIMIANDIKTTIEHRLEQELALLEKRLEKIDWKTKKRFLTKRGRINCLEKLKKETDDIRKRYYVLGCEREAAVVGFVKEGLERKIKEPLELKKAKAELWLMKQEAKKYSPYTRNLFAKEIKKEDVGILVQFLGEIDNYLARCNFITKEFGHYKVGKKAKTLYCELDKIKILLTKKAKERITYLQTKVVKTGYKLSNVIYSKTGSYQKWLLESYLEELQMWDQFDKTAGEAVRLTKDFLKNSDYIIQRCKKREEKIKSVLKTFHVV